MYIQSHYRILFAPLADSASSGVKQAQLSRRALLGKSVEMPVGHTTVHELREADDIRAHLEAALEEVF